MRRIELIDNSDLQGIVRRDKQIGSGKSLDWAGSLIRGPFEFVVDSLRFRIEIVALGNLPRSVIPHILAVYKRVHLTHTFQLMGRDHCIRRTNLYMNAISLFHRDVGRHICRGAECNRRLSSGTV